MAIRAGYEIRYETDVATPMMAMLSVHPSRHQDLLTPHRIVTAPDVPMYDYIDGFGNVCTRLTMPPGALTLSCDFLIEREAPVEPLGADARCHEVADLPDDVLVYLLGSRYCETDRLADVAWSLFGGLPRDAVLVRSIIDHVRGHLDVGYQHARPTRTAFEAYREQVGVARDVAHLAIALCRCMNVPARYCTGYLAEGSDAPTDFAVWLEVYIGQRWHALDAGSGDAARERILMAQGRDATDTAFTTSFGRATLTDFEVRTAISIDPLVP
ncbi:transglutaminase-like domain-containing protein [Sphingomonas sanxanigenens]|uniref:Transglutaminase-like domain-containing protein n=1 Tax=Sphingomonas sanxanigenens DSM 19645 = NX02 TaxID=1123269 RepID=W0AGI0_9SPHN|nr:transglutaminase family protein [Sphingomonas sanxanigenens]AHE56994.1 hypothetical protein NX02_27035 [Sphingomonas sanxanigenens DSM 19645 = NX02]